MRIEKVNDATTINKLFRPSKIQRALLNFHDDADCQVIKIVLDDGEYVKGVRSAQTVYHAAIKRLKLNMKARIFNGELYIIKL